MKRILLVMTLCATALAARSFAQHEPAKHGEAGAAAAHESQAPLLPGTLQEAKEYFLAPAVWVIVIFLIMLAILYKTAWKNVLAGLKKREQRIRQDIADAEEARKKAEETLRQYTQQLADAESRVRDMLTKATADGERLATNIRMQAQNEAEQIKERAEKDIEAAKNAAIDEIYEKTVDLATFAAEKIIGRNLNAEDQKDLVRRSLDQLPTLNKN